jgi:hypothetical protein
LSRVNSEFVTLSNLAAEFVMRGSLIYTLSQICCLICPLEQKLAADFVTTFLETADFVSHFGQTADVELGVSLISFPIHIRKILRN